MKIIKTALFLTQFVVFSWVMGAMSESHFWDFAASFSFSLIVILISFKAILASEKFQDTAFTKRILTTFYAESLIPIVVLTVILSSIIYFANSRDFYTVQSENQIRDSSHKMIPPSDHLIQSGDEYPIRVMFKKPFSWKRDAKKPLIACLLYFSLTPYIKKEKANQNLEPIVTTPVE